MKIIESPLPSLNILAHKTYDLLREHFLKILALSTSATVLSFACAFLFVIISRQQILYVQDSASSDLTSLWPIFLVLLFLGALLFVIQIFVNGVFVLIFSNEKTIAWSRLLYRTLYRLWPLIILSLIILLFTIAISILADIFGSAVGFLVTLLNQTWISGGFSFGDILAALGLLLVSIYLAFSPYFLLLSEQSPLESLRSGFDLVYGNFWHVFWRIVLVYIALFGFGIFLQFVPYFGAVLATLFIPPLLVGYLFVLFEHLKKIK